MSQMKTSEQSFRLDPIDLKAAQLPKAENIRVWSLTFDLPGEKVNKLSQAVMKEVEQLLSRLEKMGKERKIDALILLSGKVGNFIAGADIEMIQAVRTPQEAEALSRAGQVLIDRWEDLPFPTVAAVNGAALGGGCEFALASTAIVMSNDSVAKIGLPEVLLGLIPGMGGCVRLPRRVGIATALDLILTGKTLNGQRAAKAGLADVCLPKENFNESVIHWTVSHWQALKSSKRIAQQPKLGGFGGPVGSLLEKTPARAIIFKKARESVLSRTQGHYPAPLEAIQVLQDTDAAYGPKLKGSQRDAAMKREAKSFGRLASSEVSKNLIRLFFLTEGVKKSKGVDSKLGGSQGSEKKLHSAAVLGAGVMGGGIAQLFADKNLPVRMKDLNVKALSLGVQAASKIFTKQVQKKKINKRELLQKLNLIAPCVDFSGFNTVDLVVEAIVENLDVKKKVLQELEGQVQDGCVVATNTSSLSVSAMQSGLKHPERFVGMHFFNPVHKMPLVEVIRGAQTSDQAVSAVFQLSKTLGKTPIVVKDAPGFLVNRLLMPYLNEAVYLLADGVPIPEIDRVLLDFGMPMGPMELIDEVGVDVGDKVSHILHEAFGDRMAPAPLNGKAVAAGRLGKKNGLGLYRYVGPKKTQELDPQIYEIMGVRVKPHALAHEEMIERCILPMINEASRCLEEGIVSSPAEVDLGMIMGTGFPPFRGGLLRYADTLGARAIVDRLRKYEARFGARFAPSPALLARAEHGQSFYSQS
jgi:3-hydroxyacyl-CoA dehydrogenase/enoyl-CoA hydratase/3-hydroxybutyryl-CoA epimerase